MGSRASPARSAARGKKQEARGKTGEPPEALPPIKSFI